MKNNPDEKFIRSDITSFGFPEGLTGKDRELIIEQCVLQHATSPEQLRGFAEAYLSAKTLGLDKERLKSLTSEKVKECIISWGEIIEKRNKKGFRKTPVHFANMSRALDPEVIDRAIGGLVDAFVDKTIDPLEFYTEFEKIHPFEDGNGRVGDLLWKLATIRETGVWPETLPPDVFGSH